MIMKDEVDGRREEGQRRQEVEAGSWGATAVKLRLG